MWYFVVQHFVTTVKDIDTFYYINNTFLKHKVTLQVDKIRRQY